jgi:hypothetical protein
MNVVTVDKALPATGYVCFTRKAARTHRTQRQSVLISHPRGSSHRGEIEEFLRREFRDHFGADLKRFMPQLVALHAPDGAVRAVVGCRSAAHEKLFLETYTIRPVEELIAERVGIVVPRAEIVEVGSLACRNGRAATEIVLALVPALIEAGFTWVVFTGADTVRNVFRRLRLAPHALCAADQTLLGADRHDWGRYYDHNPIVMAGRIADGLAALETPVGVQ